MDALLVVHMQVGLLTGEPKHDLRGVLERINRLSARVRAESGQVILIRHCGGRGDDFEPQTPGWEFLPDLARSPQDTVMPDDLERSVCRDRFAKPAERNPAEPGSCHGLGD